MKKEIIFPAFYDLHVSGILGAPFMLIWKPRMVFKMDSDFFVKKINLVNFFAKEFKISSFTSLKMYAIICYSV